MQIIFVRNEKRIDSDFFFENARCNRCNFLIGSFLVSYVRYVDDKFVLKTKGKCAI